GRTGDAARRRTDRQSRFKERRSRHGAPSRAPSDRGDHLHGDARPALRPARRTEHSPLRRPHRRGTRNDVVQDFSPAWYGERMLISLRNLERSYPQGVARSYVLRRITADIKPGEFVSIMGPSG